MIHREPRDATLVLRLEHGKANAIDIELLADLAQALRETTDAPALVLTGTGPMFSAGVDLFRIVNGGRAYVDRFLPALSDLLYELFAFPRPIVAAVNGHAIAGGTLLACACDYRVMAEGGGRMGVPELLVGVPMPAVPLELLRAVLPPQQLQYLLISGRTVPAAEALARGLVDELAPAEGLLERALATAAGLAAVPADAFTHTKRALRQPALERMRATRPGNDAELAPLWAAPETLDGIRSYLERAVGRSR